MLPGQWEAAGGHPVGSTVVVGPDLFHQIPLKQLFGRDIGRFELIRRTTARGTAHGCGVVTRRELVVLVRASITDKRKRR